MMDYDQMWAQLHRRKMLDPEYRECQARIEALEPEYLRIRDTLAPEDREILDSYIGACEAAGDLLTALAWKLGKTAGDFLIFPETDLENRQDQ